MPSTICDVSGLRMKHLLPTERIGVVCDRCGKAKTHHIEELQRGFLPVYPVWYLEDAISYFCRSRREGGDCGREFITPEMGCSDAG